MPPAPLPSNWAELPDYLPPTLSETVSTIRLDKGQSLFHTGDRVESFYLVRTGDLVAVRSLPSGAEAIMVTARAGEFFGESSLFQLTYTCEARARSTCVLASFNAERFRQAMAGDTTFALAFTRTMAIALRKQCSRVERLRLKSATDRVIHYLACETGPSGWAELGGTLQEWAAELALEPETLYRTLAQLEKDGMLAREQRRLRLLRHNGMACASLSQKT